jgi:RHS repeat-associated protein
MLSRDYDPYGNPIAAATQSGYAFTGREWDAETGLYYYRARYYDPKIGRFLSEDPIGFGGGVNFYAYVLNNPTNNTDPFGLLTQQQSICLSTFILAGGMAGGGLGAAAGAAATAGTAGIALPAIPGGAAGGAAMGGAVGGAIGLIVCNIPPPTCDRGPKDKWTCLASGHVTPYADKNAAGWISTALGYGPTQSIAAQNALNNLQAQSPPGTYMRHMQVKRCWRN